MTTKTKKLPVNSPKTRKTKPPKLLTLALTAPEAQLLLSVVEDGIKDNTTFGNLDDVITLAKLGKVLDEFTQDNPDVYY